MILLQVLFKVRLTLIEILLLFLIEVLLLVFFRCLAPDGVLKVAIELFLEVALLALLEIFLLFVILVLIEDLMVLLVLVFFLRFFLWLLLKLFLVVFLQMCEMSMKVDIKENHLVLLHGNAKCKIRVSKFWGKLIRGYARKKMEELIESKLKELVNKMVIPREATVVVDVETTIVYYEGSLVVRGKLSLVPEVIQQTLRRATRRKY
ncbi:uncharacterized protein LOC109513753 isoform X3 [Hippocampus comes]|uniref:uncharacterized protein LOC109513753 isoform X3 n=1 Tax=Hippocampus comes TaxID=109280 RepID=UPI00094E36C0|nr:PREDICTED: uncharacterized protein LOC109513753 isoform X3 [Hippocampus comes]